MNKIELLDVVNSVYKTKINKVTEKQQQWLNERYNLINAQFEYAVCNKGYTFIGDSDELNKLKYFLGLEYDEAYELANLVVGSQQIIIYSYRCDRAYDLLNELFKLEKF